MTIAAVPAPDPTTQGAAIEAAMFLNAWIYGDGTLPAEFQGASSNDGGYDDDYDGFIDAATAGSWDLLGADDLPDTYFDAAHGITDGGLYIGQLPGTPDSGAEALVAVTEIDGQTTMVIAIRGADDDSAAFGPPFFAPLTLQFYAQLRPLFQAAADYAADPANGIDAAILSGHSLGGTMADVFSLIDAGLFTDNDVPLTVVSLASAGVAEGVVTLAEFLQGQSLRIPGASVGAEPVLLEPDDFMHIGVTQTADPVRYPEDFSLPVVQPLLPNLHFAPDLVIETPNIEFDAADGSFGAGHSIFLYWPNILALVNDGLYAAYTDQTVIMGVSNYDSQPTFTDMPVVNGYVPQYAGFTIDDRGVGALRGTQEADFILGLDGRDWLLGRYGDDLMSGGADNDLLLGGAGDDSLDGGTGIDIVLGGDGADLLRSLGDGDLLIGGDDADVFQFTALETGAAIRDFETDLDAIDLSLLGLTESDVSWSDVQGGVAVDADGTIIFLSGLSSADLDYDDFILEPEIATLV
ncbi:hypothetical protein SAMN05421759_11836 [Roseivivax lentus]|uniref:Hemolysin-type calcium-binding repeat-containing protein n=1 Tax=Roseivivax lentus TaxID=633194 RepID=A0A1N7PPB3_9RHOB|nr:hypothetical protein [Roseivivax lentus]SIT12494.1 hypothetical protein SAMN05421759_11836 [Roseivivax lentus]